MNSTTRYLTVATFVAAAFFGGNAARAASSACVTNSAQLHDALTNFAANLQAPGSIHIVEGTYQLGSDFEMAASAPISLIGGYLDCNQHDPFSKPATTIIDFGGHVATFEQLQNNGVTASLSLENLTFRNGAALLLQAGDYVDDNPGSLSIRRMRFSGFRGTNNYNPPIWINAVHGRLDVENVLFDQLIDVPNSRCEVQVTLGGDSYANIRFVTAGLISGTSFCLESVDDHNTVDIADSLFAATQGPPVAPPLLKGLGFGDDDDLSVLVTNTGFGGVDPGSFGNWIVTDQVHEWPNWINPTQGDFHLQAPSTSIDGGTTQIPYASVPPIDIDGDQRPYAGSAPDLGAYEFQSSAVPTTVVTNTNDSGLGSLRQAIHNANITGGGVVTFDIPGACPRLLFLSSPLEPVATQVTIDGTTQPGSTVNQSSDGFNATLCVALLPNGNVPNAFKVSTNAPPDASLSVRGLFFGPFQQPVMLLGGRNHWIRGNQFGGTFGGVAVPGAGLNAIAIGGNAIGYLMIGGDDPSNRNVIDGSNGALSAGISVQKAVVGCQIDNNLIGVDIDGLTPRPNALGINLNGSGCDIRSNRIANNTRDGIWVQGDDNTIERNVIGMNFDGSAAPNAGYGIRISGNENTIGLARDSTFDGGYHANDVLFNAAGGIAVTTGVGNTIRSNTVTGNGSPIGSSMDIDLGADGATQNLVPNPDNGPNGLQNHPAIIGVAYAAPPTQGAMYVPATVNGVLSSNAGTYRVDVFSNPACTPDQRGHAGRYLGDGLVTVPAGGEAVTFSISVVLPLYAPADVSVDASATNTVNGNSSEMGRCSAEDTIFSDPFER
jgi:parallel beta-helix repeat protein